MTLREVVNAVMTFEYSARIAEEIEAYVRELGSEGRLVEMQLEQAFHGVPEQYEALLRTTSKKRRTTSRQGGTRDPRPSSSLTLPGSPCPGLRP